MNGVWHHYDGAVGEEFQRAGTAKMYREAVHSKWLPLFLTVCTFSKRFCVKKWPVSFDLL